MPDGPREPFRPTVRLEPRQAGPTGFTAINTSGISAPELAALNRALARLMAAGLTEHQAKVAIDEAVREWLRSGGGDQAAVERILAKL